MWEKKVGCEFRKREKKTNVKFTAMNVKRGTNVGRTKASQHYSITISAIAWRTDLKAIEFVLFFMRLIKNDISAIAPRKDHRIHLFIQLNKVSCRNDNIDLIFILIHLVCTLYLCINLINSIRYLFFVTR